MTSRPTRHLDLGCGATPRNPYRRDELHGVDIAPRHGPAGPPQGRAAERPARSLSDAPGRYQVHQGNLALDGLPFEAGHFDSVSAYDFFEHVPRVLPTADGRATRLPFVELMNEVSRVLRPGGLLHAVTPCYPSAEAFQDPTHVNIITDRTHLYFTGTHPLGRMYGFSGHFSVKRVEWVVFGDALDPLVPLNLHQRWRRLNYRRKGQLSHLLWEFECSKPAG